MGKETQILSRKKALANQPYFQGVLAGLGQRRLDPGMDTLW